MQEEHGKVGQFDGVEPYKQDCDSGTQKDEPFLHPNHSSTELLF